MNNATRSIWSRKVKLKVSGETGAIHTPNSAELHRAAIDDISDILNDPDVVHRASEVLGALIDRITICHDAERGHTAQLEGKLLGLLSFADNKKAASYSDAACSLKLVAGVGFEPTTFRL